MLNQQQINNIFKIASIDDFNETALEIFRYQLETNSIYRDFVTKLRLQPEKVLSYHQIPFLPIDFFKNHQVICGSTTPKQWFESSRTTGITFSKHFYHNLTLYEKSFLQNFRMNYGAPEDYCFLAMLPSYLESSRSSLVYMVGKLIETSKNLNSRFYKDNFNEIAEALTQLDQKGQKTMLLGVSFALLDLVSDRSFKLKNTIIVETGGMKGRKREMVRDELHKRLKSGFGVDVIHSEYGMTELFSQAWSDGNGKFITPPWMKVLIRDINDPLSLLKDETTGGINIIDLANVHSCAFIATQDLGRKLHDGSFEVLGRFDNSDIRGCNLLMA
ncbi:MAG TPA: acyltransferase [Bacteroidales bacterium]|nr:acyltransferase [Bacteroidales bacterium]HPW43935.1 acyltransferase [Bacteroidales bacterium]